MSRRIYLHIFDRELRQYCQSQLADKDITEIVMMACILGDEVNIPYSNLMESSGDYPKSVSLAFALEKNGCCRILTSENNMDAFMVSHRNLYQKVRERYPFYFSDTASLFPAFPKVPFRDTTAVLRDKMLEELKKAPHVLWNIYDPLRDALSDPNRGAITIGNIKKSVDLTSEQKIEIARMISKSYSERYLEEVCGRHICGIPYLVCLDKEIGESNISYIHYMPILKRWLFNQWLREDAGNYTIEKMPDRIMALKSGDSLFFIQCLISSIESISRHFREAGEEPIKSSIRKYIYNELVGIDKVSINEAVCRLIKVKEMMLRDGIEIKEDVLSMKKVLLVVATDAEQNVVTQRYRERYGSLVNWMSNNVCYISLGIIGQCEVTLVRTSMGAMGPLGAICTVEKAIAGYNPDFVIMVGIAYSLKDDIHIGDVMISNSLKDIESGKVTIDPNSGEEVYQSRGLDSPADATLWQAFATTHSTKQLDYKVHTGTILTGCKVINSQNVRVKLKQLFPQAIGGEMEGNGLIAAQHTPWILVKAVCDNGVDKTDKYQEMAALNAIDYVENVLTIL